MSVNKKNVEERPKNKTKDIKQGLKFLNKEWIKNPWIFSFSLIIGPVIILGAIFVPIENNLLSWLQTLIFFIGIGFVVLPFSYLFNLLWILLLRK
ncbi:MAG: hypothetical protein ACTSQE_05670 [Candidatus Heimdallarchaeaceae archaeon]